jgi:uncharacterized membrane protein (UPF0127 family)
MRNESKWIALVALLLTAGCVSSSSPGGLPVTPMRIGSRMFHLEIAGDDASREQGLMERDSMEADHGMIFVFPDCKDRSFWMHHTRFPLDIIFADDHAKVVSIHSMRAYDESNTYSNGPAKYAIELNVGAVAACGVKPGDTLQIPPAVATAKAN